MEKKPTSYINIFNQSGIVGTKYQHDLISLNKV